VACVARLHAYLASVRHRPFQWGAHDCVIFARDAVAAYTGKAHTLPAYTTLREAVIAARNMSIVEELDRRFARCRHVPPVGSLVAVVDSDAPGIGYRLGVVVSDKAAFVSPSGLTFAKLRPNTDLYWTVT
jgi:hypothetical protein